MRLFMKRRNLIHSNLKFTGKRSTLRRNPTAAETVLWKNLQNSQLDGKKFRRQHSIGPYIVDFYCSEYRVAIELDGAKHMTPIGNETDEKRDEFLRRLNVRVLRFENRLVFESLELVLNTIRAALEPPPV
jgi:very-short-patch-repair endonuclease